jgi:hypothetical protein
MRKWILRIAAIALLLVVGGIAAFVITWSNPASAQSVAINALANKIDFIQVVV